MAEFDSCEGSKVKVIWVSVSVVLLGGGAIVRRGSVGNSGVKGHDPGTTKEFARFRAQIVLILVSNGEGLGMRPRDVVRKKASWRASTLRAEVKLGTKPGSDSASDEARSITAPMETLLICCATSRNSGVVVTGNWYLHGGTVEAL